MIVLFIALAVAASSPNVASFITGADLFKQWQAKDELQLACNSYITGVSDAHSFHDSVLKKGSICFPDRTSIGDTPPLWFGS